MNNITLPRAELQAALDALDKWYVHPNEVEVMTTLRSRLAEPAYSWECNECGAQEYTMAVSENDIHRLACGRCGSDEWHKEKTR